MSSCPTDLLPPFNSTDNGLQASKEGCRPQITKKGQKDFGSIALSLTTRNRTKDTLMSAIHYSQMLCQLSYGEAM